MNPRSTVASAFTATMFRDFPTSSPPRVVGGRLYVPPALLAELSREAFSDAAFYFRRSHLSALAAALEDREASENDRTVLRFLLRNALIASGGKLALCQDTGTATVVAWKDESVFTGGNDVESLEEGARRAYQERFLRNSQVAPISFFEEVDTGNNLPAQVHLESVPDSLEGPAYRLLFVAKGGGSSNKTALFQMTKALLEPDRFDAFLAERVAALGTAACPPYRLAVVVGGTSPEENLRVLKLATTEVLDGAPPFGEGDDKGDRAPGGYGPTVPEIRRDSFWEERLLHHARTSGLGAQFGGVELALDARVLRLPRHAASCPLSIGVSCSAHRNVLAQIDAGGVRIEELEKNPARFLRSLGGEAARCAAEFEGSGESWRRPDPTPRLDLDRPMEEIRADLSRLSIGDRVLLNGEILVARDAAHQKWRTLLSEGRELPNYLFRHPVMYAGPAATPPGAVIGSFGPTTAQRMDAYAEELLSRGASLVTLAKGNRGPAWTEACHKHGGFYLGVVGGAAALVAAEHILENRILDYPDLGMEAVRLIRVIELPAVLVVDHRGNDLY